MSIYELLNIPTLKNSYPRKFQTVAFFGVHLPLICLVVYLLWFSDIGFSRVLPIIVVTLIATLVGSLATVWIHQKLMSPLLLTVESLKQYRNEHKALHLPVQFQDEIGTLMAEIQSVVSDLDALLRARMEFVAILSHDMRTPLTTIMLLGEILEAKAERGDMKSASIIHDANTIRKIAKEQLQIMNHMIDLIRSQSTTISVTPLATPIMDLFKDIEQTATPIASAKGIKLRIELGSGLAPSTFVVIDPPKTAQILNNLVHNAVKYIKSDCNGEIVLSAEKRPDTLIFGVHDNGVGMDDEILQSLFVPFTKATRQGTAMELSTGLGLWICKAFTEAQGGKIEVRSEINKGSCFSVILPQPLSGPHGA
ncbi:MAG: HAMP domain-containing sensor histidine kinase [Caldilineaceae bacterium]